MRDDGAAREAVGAKAREAIAAEERAAAADAYAAQLAESEERYRLVVESAADFAIFTMDLEGRVTLWNAGAGNPLGYRTEEIVGRPGAVIFTPEDREAGVPEREMAAALEQGRAENERWHLRKDGTRFWSSGLVMPLKDAGGGVQGFLKILRDRTDKRREEEHRQLLLHELNHRVKNTLAMVQALVQQTLRSAEDLPQANATLRARLLALAKAHDLLTRESWEGAELADIVADALAPYGNGGGRVAVEGEPVRVTPRTALALALALHELATNAAKYGALSTAAGQVAVSWGVETGTAPPRLHLRWAESGGPPVAPPRRRGFGSRLVEQGLAEDLGGRVRLEFAPAGLVCTVEAPLEPAGGRFMSLA